MFYNLRFNHDRIFTVLNLLDTSQGVEFSNSAAQKIKHGQILINLRHTQTSKGGSPLCMHHTLLSPAFPNASKKLHAVVLAPNHFCIPFLTFHAAL